MNVQLIKLGCSYMSTASGPAAIRYIRLPEVDLEFSEEYVKRSTSNINGSERTYKNNYSEQHTLPEELTADVYTLNNAYKEFEEAEEAFRKAQDKLAQQRQEFMKTEAGKFIENLRNPSQKLKLRDILSEETEALIRKDVEKLGEIEVWEPCKDYYSNVQITIKFKKGTQALYGQCVEFKSNGFKCHQVAYSKSSENRIRTLTIKYEGGKYEAPHIRQDHVEVELYNKLWMFRKSKTEEQAIKDTFATLKLMGYNEADYEDTIKRICEYVKAKASEPQEMTEKELAEALASLGHNCE